MGWAATAGRAAEVVRTVVVAPTSETVPHAWHSPQRPTHFTVLQPHSVQRKVGRCWVLVLMRSTS